MFLLTTTGFVFEKEHWVRFIKEKNIKKVILVRLVKKDGPFDWSRDYQSVLSEITNNKNYSKGDQEALSKAFNTVSSLLDLLKQLYLEIEYHELLEEESELTKTAYLSRVVAQQKLRGLIDIAQGERIVSVSFFKVAQYFPEKIIEFGLSDFMKQAFIPIITPFLDPDPDQRQKTTYKEILSKFIPKKSGIYTELLSKVTFGSKEMEEKIPELAVSHLKNRISTMIKSKPGIPCLLVGKEDPNSKRKYNYQISEYGLFILYINFLRYTLDISGIEREDWFMRIKDCFATISFRNFHQILKFEPFSN